MHGGDLNEPGKREVGDLTAEQMPGNDPYDIASCRKCGVGQQAHEPYCAAAVNHGDAVVGQQFAEGVRGVGEFGTCRLEEPQARDMSMRDRVGRRPDRHWTRWPCTTTAPSHRARRDGRLAWRLQLARPAILRSWMRSLPEAVITPGDHGGQPAPGSSPRGPGAGRYLTVTMPPEPVSGPPWRRLEDVADAATCEVEQR